LGKRSLLTDREAWAIAQKLDAAIATGRKHERATVRLNGQFVGQFGIRRGTGLGHDYVPKQIQATTRQALDLARCPLSKEGFIELLVAQGKLNPPDEEQNPNR
jgi:hypothetical protein